MVINDEGGGKSKDSLFLYVLLMLVRRDVRKKSLLSLRCTNSVLALSGRQGNSDLSWGNKESLSVLYGSLIAVGMNNQVREDMNGSM